MNLLSVNGLSFKYDSYILKNLSFDVEEGAFISLLGVNGSGKSTLLKNLSKILKPTGGKIYIGSEDLSHIKNRELAKCLATVNQYNTPLRNTVYDMILVGRVPHIERDVTEKDYQIVDEIIEKLELEKYALRMADTLSGGEFQKVVLARALAQEPKILLLDEPTSNLDIKNQVEVMELVAKYSSEKGIAVIVSIHDLNLALQFSQKFLLLKDGKVFDYGGEEVITKEAISHVYKVKTQVIDFEGRKVIVLC